MDCQDALNPSEGTATDKLKSQVLLSTVLPCWHTTVLTEYCTPEMYAVKYFFCPHSMTEYVNYEEVKSEDREKGEAEYLASSIYQIKYKSK